MIFIYGLLICKELNMSAPEDLLMILPPSFGKGSKNFAFATLLKQAKGLRVNPSRLLEVDI